MFGTLLEKLGTLLPKNFIIANLFPILMFAAANGFMLYWLSGRFHVWVENYFAMSAADQAFVGFSILIALSLAAYISSTVNLFQREILEGHYWPKRLKNRLAAGQQRKLDYSAAQLLKSRKSLRELRKLKGEKKLQKAREAGKGQPAPCLYSDESDAARAVADLAGRRERHDIIKVAELEIAITSFAQALEACAVDVRNADDPDFDNKQLLDRDHQILVECLHYVQQEIENEYNYWFNKIEFNYSSFRLAPTAMGNIAESTRGYALSRYGMNLDPVWSRLQKILVNDEKFYSSLVDAKTQLDFLISLFWLTVIFTLFWSIELLYLRRSIVAFLLVTVGGPLLSILWYQIALQNYRAFADILRSSIDLYRFELLALLRIQPPKGNANERETWATVSKVIGFGDPAVQIPYQAPPKQP